MKSEDSPVDRPRSRPVALTIAGSDSGGGAGIQADLKTFEAYGVFGTTALTAVTAQSTVGVRAVHLVTPLVLEAQIAAVAEDLEPAAVKTGMLATAELVAAGARAIRSHRLSPLVVDPVMVSTSGDRLLDEDAVARLLSDLLPLATLATPNLAEAEILTGREIRDASEMLAAARALVDTGCGAALVKGGHLAGERIRDVFWDGRVERVWETTRLPGRNTHGTGCTLSAAITAGLALGNDLEGAIDSAIGYTRRAIAAAPGLGAGSGPLDHRGAGLGVDQAEAQDCSP